MNYFTFILIFVVIGAFMYLQTKTMRKQQKQVRSFQENLQPGTLVITVGGIIGKVVSVDTQYEEIVIDSEGTLLRFSFRAVSKEYIRPAFIPDEEEEENLEEGSAKNSPENSGASDSHNDNYAQREESYDRSTPNDDFTSHPAQGSTQNYAHEDHGSAEIQHNSYGHGENGNHNVSDGARDNFEESLPHSGDDSHNISSDEDDFPREQPEYGQYAPERRYPQE